MTSVMQHTRTPHPREPGNASFSPMALCLPRCLAPVCQICPSTVFTASWKTRLWHICWAAFIDRKRHLNTTTPCLQPFWSSKPHKSCITWETKTSSAVDSYNEVLSAKNHKRVGYYQGHHLQRASDNHWMPICCVYSTTQIHENNTDGRHHNFHIFLVSQQLGSDVLTRIELYTRTVVMCVWFGILTYVDQIDGSM